MFMRGIATIFLLCAYGWFYWAVSVTAPLVSGPLAGKQMEPSNTMYVESQVGALFNGSLPWWFTLGSLALLAWIWWHPTREAIKKALVVVAVVLILPATAHAYYDKSDYAEVYTILPNESAFWIPDVGDNKASQVQLDSEQYLVQNKVATKRFQIPHVHLSGSGSFFDYYVPSGRLIIVDRTPYSREWVAGERGTSKKDESFPCQSREGLNISVGVSIGASVTEINAAKFLFRFGVVTPKVDRLDPKIIFSSVYFGRSLIDVMDDVGRKKIQTLVCHEFAARSFEDGNAQQNQIMDTVTKQAADWFTAYGVTLDFLGYADTLTFDKDVQAAVNDRYTADKIAPVLAVLQTKAILDASAKWNGVLPNLPGFVVIPGDFFEKVASWFSAATRPQAKP
jgi:hypothetical protein